MNATVPNNPSRATPRRAPRPAGFTLIETTLAIVIVGVGVLSIVAAQQAYHIKNDYALRTGTAQQLAQEVRELMAGLPHHDPHINAHATASYGLDAGESATSLGDYDDLDDFAGTVAVTGYGDGAEFNPPIAADGNTIPELSQWTQRVEVVKVLRDDISMAGGLPLSYQDATDPPMMRVTVEVYHQAPADAQRGLITTLTWVEPG